MRRRLPHVRGPASSRGRSAGPGLRHARSSPGDDGSTIVFVTTWFGAFLVADGTVVRAVPCPLDPDALAQRAARRREGGLTPEEEELLGAQGSAEWVTRDRRLAEHGLRFDADSAVTIDAVASGVDPTLQRTALLSEAEHALELGVGPQHSRPGGGPRGGRPRPRAQPDRRAPRHLGFPGPPRGGSGRSRPRGSGGDGPGSDLGAVPQDPSLTEARRKLAELFRAVEGTRHALTKAIEATAPVRAPNVSTLLGPELSARIIAQAGGLERLARLPSSTVQVLGAERAFFEHLRGRAPPPRHGLLFLHPAIQSAPKGERGKLARALAGKVSIAARLDVGGAPIHPELAQSFDARRSVLKARRGAGRGPPRARRSGPPLDGASRNR